MADKKPTDNEINYECEYIKCLEEIRHLKMELERAVCDLRSIETERDVYERELTERDNKISFLEGQIKAFQFCVAGGRQKNA